MLRKLDFSGFSWHLRRIIESGGMPGAIAAILGCVVVIFLLLGVLPRELTLQRLRNADSNVIARTPIDDASAAVSRRSADFYARFPTTDTLLNQIRHLNDAADRAMLPIDEAHFKLSADEHAKLLRYEINLTSRAPYGAIRAFLASCMSELPALSIDSIALSRDKASDSLLGVQIRLTLYLRAVQS